MAENDAGKRSSGDADRRTNEQTPTEYRPPEVERIGSLRDLLGKTGTFADNPAGHPFRPTPK